MKNIDTFAKSYDPKSVESEIYKMWEENGDFSPIENSEKEPYVIMIPPPNVTGSLHMGHALNNTLMDILIRHARMQGHPTLWLPGTDHAGIATQNKVEKKLAKQGIKRQDLGREKFVEEVWQWKNEHGDRIKLQLKRLGASCDWSRERFTLDEKYSQAVKFAFEHYKNKGWIYQGERLVNWCPRCSSAISDLEVNHTSEKAVLYFIKYLLKDSEEFITVATTRPETMLGDTAIAVNPKDSRYLKLIGQTAILPLVEREIKIIGDESVDKEFGTGAVKVTPAHSEADWEIGQRHNLTIEKVISEQGRIINSLDELNGLKVIEARDQIVQKLQQKDLLSKQEEIIHNIARCDRCEHTIEPLVSKQWFLKMQELARPAIKAIEEGEIKFYPTNYKKVYLDWLKNIKDWCISRQLWWGHPIPIEGSEDVLDTWFSSALWPFATLGWPEKTNDLNRFYPTEVILTAKDIIFLWVARMIFSGYEFMGQKPFKNVYFHPTVLNKEGRRMSKSLGTGVDPMDLMDEFGSDATRFGLVWQNMGLQQFKFSQEPILTGKKFANKIWNASRFVLLQLDEDLTQVKIEINTHEDKQILDSFVKITKALEKDLSLYQFGQPLHDLYEFFWHEFCDQYLEASKKQIQDPKFAKNTKAILLTVLTGSLKLIHPFMPFVTEAIWQELVQNKLTDEKRLIQATWPKI